MFGTNSITPMDSLRGEYARIMNALVRAMDAAENWHDIKRAADLMTKVAVCQFGPRLREAEYLSQDRSEPTPGTPGQGPLSVLGRAHIERTGDMPRTNAVPGEPEGE